MSETKTKLEISKLLNNLNAKLSDENFKLSDKDLRYISLETGNIQATAGRILLKQTPEKFNQHFVMEHILDMREETGKNLMEQITYDLQCISNFVEPLKNKADTALKILKE